jgi:hypothetical protein
LTIHVYGMDALNKDSAVKTKFIALRKYLTSFTVADIVLIDSEHDMLDIVPQNLRALMLLFLKSVVECRRPQGRECLQNPSIVVIDNHIHLRGLVTGLKFGSCVYDDVVQLRNVSKSIARGLVGASSGSSFEYIVLDLSDNKFQDIDVSLVASIAKTVMASMTTRLTLDLSENHHINGTVDLGDCEDVNVGLVDSVTELLGHNNLEYLNLCDTRFASLSGPMRFFANCSAEHFCKLIWITEKAMHGGKLEWRIMLEDRTDDIDTLVEKVLSVHEAFYNLTKQRNAAAAAAAAGNQE